MKEGDEEINGMLILLQIMMTLSSSNAACERGFPCINNQKTKLRTSLSNQSLDDIMRICIDGPDLKKCDTKSHVQNWVSSAKGTRYLDGHSNPPPRKKKKD